MKRRGRGEGSIYQQPDGLWVGAVTLGVLGGKRRRRKIRRKRKSDVVRELARLTAQAASGSVTAVEKVTLAAHISRWLDEVAAPRVRPNTLRGYRGAFKIHIRDRLGDVVVAKLVLSHIQTFMADLERAGASGRVRQIVLVVLRQALANAVELGFATTNVALSARMPRHERKEIEFLEEPAVVRLLEAIRGHELEALYELALATGMRQGELLGLRILDLDLGKRIVRVRQQLIEIDGSFSFGDLKTKRGRRDIDISARAARALERHLPERVNDGAGADGLVFVGARGEPWRKSNLMRRAHYPLLAGAGLPAVTFHALRHTHATILLRHGVPAHVVSARLGHADVATTLRVYAHVMRGQAESAAEVMADALSRAVQERPSPPSEMGSTLAPPVGEIDSAPLGGARESEVETGG